MQQESARDRRSTAADTKTVLTAADAGSAATDRRPSDGIGTESDRSAARSTTGRRDSYEPAAEPAVPAAELAALAAELRALRGAVESLTECRRTDESSTGSFEWVESPQPAVPIEPLTERIEALEARTVAIESALDAVPPSALEAAVERQQTASAALEARLETDLDGVEAVFEHLLSVTDTFDERLDGIDAAREAAIEPLQRRTAEQTALVGLTREALCHGVSTADCNHCGQSVDIGLLETPYCPGCDRRFTGIDPGGWLPFSSATLRTAGRHALSRVLGVDAEPSQR